MNCRIRKERLSEVEAAWCARLVARQTLLDREGEAKEEAFLSEI